MATWDFDWLSSRRLTNQNVIVLWLFEILIGQAAANQLIRTASSWNIIIQWTSHDDLTEKSAETFFIPQYGDPKEKTCRMTDIQNCTLWFDKKMLQLNFVSMQFWTEILQKSSNQSGSQIHEWILLKKRIYYIRI